MLPETTNERYNNFELLRLLAALLVLIYHSYWLWNITDPLLRVGIPYPLSGCGVAIFFVISGFLVCKSLLHSTIKGYLLNRFLRIWPALAACTVFTLIVPGLFFTTLPTKEFLSHPQTLYFFWQNLLPYRVAFYLPGVFNGESVNGSLWTIPLEIKLYFVLLIISLAGLLKRKELFLFAWIAVLILFVAFNSSFVKLDKYFEAQRFFIYGLLFSGGALFYLFKEKIPFTWYIFIFLFVAYTATLLWFPSLQRITEYPFYIYTVLAIGCSKTKIPFMKADISYGMYLYAFPIQQCIYYTWGTSLSFLNYNLLAIALTSILATASWYIIEKKALLLKKRSGFSMLAGYRVQHPEENTYKQK